MTSSANVTTGTTATGILKHPAVDPESMTLTTDAAKTGSQESEESVENNNIQQQKTLLESRLKMINLLKVRFGDEISRIPDFLEFEASVKQEYLASKKRTRKKTLVDSYTQTPSDLLESLLLQPGRLVMQKQHPASLSSDQKVQDRPLSLSPKSLALRSRQQMTPASAMITSQAVSPAPVSSLSSTSHAGRVWDSHPRQAWIVSSPASSSIQQQQQQQVHHRLPLQPHPSLPGMTTSSVSSSAAYLQRFPVRTYTEREAEMIHGMTGSEDDFDAVSRILNQNHLRHHVPLSSTSMSAPVSRGEERRSLVVEESASSEPDDSSRSSSSPPGNVVYKNIIITLRSDESSDQEACSTTPTVSSTCPVHGNQQQQHFR